MRFLVLSSGSKGNCTYIGTAHSNVLIDCGIGIRRIAELLRQHGVDYRAIDAVLVTHLHSDHIGSLGVFLKHVPARVYVQERAADDLRASMHQQMAYAKRAAFNSFELSTFNGGDGFPHRDLDVLPVPVSHDADPTVMYKLHSEGKWAGVLTDLGQATEHIGSTFSGCDALLLEANHDEEMLKNGPYPLQLKRRVKGSRGHLSNIQAVQFATGLSELPRHLFLGHMSDTNNTPAIASDAFTRIETGRIPHTAIPQQTCSGMVEL
jgi:phosphoribosyl 1,2-cyclic phosphodiesterase